MSYRKSMWSLYLFKSRWIEKEEKKFIIDTQIFSALINKDKQRKINNLKINDIITEDQKVIQDEI